METSLNEEKIRSLLVLEYQRRRKKNPRYSVRAFASSLNLDQSLLGKVMGSQVKIGPQYSLQIIKQLAQNNAALLTLFNTSINEEYVDTELIFLNYYIKIPKTNLQILSPRFEKWHEFLNQEEFRGKLHFNWKKWCPDDSPFKE